MHTEPPTNEVLVHKQFEWRRWGIISLNPYELMFTLLHLLLGIAHEAKRIGPTLKEGTELAPTMAMGRIFPN